MRSNYKLLGNYIREVNIRNKELRELVLLGVSIQKEFIPSIANTIGTDMSTYKIIKRNQFAYGPVTSRNGDKISIALLYTHYEALISQSYKSFEIIDENELMPEYLMMWFRRPEFDRYARYMSHGSTRETFDWVEMCNTELPVPSIEKQREIVKEYKVLQDRISLNNTLIEKLEQTSETIYKQWFVYFDFPDENQNPYKSSGGDMELNIELDKEIPVGWQVKSIGEILMDKGYIRGPFGSALKKDDMIDKGIPIYEQQHAIDNHRNFRYFISEEKYNTLKRFTVRPDDFVISCSGTLGKITVISKDDPIGVINQALLILRVDPIKLVPICFKYFLTSKEGNNLLIADAGGSAQVNIAKREEIQSIKLLIPEQFEQKKVSRLLSICDEQIINRKKENCLLENTKSILLSKLATVEG